MKEFDYIIIDDGNVNPRYHTFGNFIKINHIRSD